MRGAVCGRPALTWTSRASSWTRTTPTSTSTWRQACRPGRHRSKRHRGDDHRGAADLLRTATPDGPSLATTLLRLLDVKDEAHYGLIIVAPRRARDAVRWATKLAYRAAEEQSGKHRRHPQSPATSYRVVRGQIAYEPIMPVIGRAAFGAQVPGTRVFWHWSFVIFFRSVG